MPQQRDAVAGVHAGAFRRPEERLQEQQLNPLVLDPKTGLTAAQIEAQSHVPLAGDLASEVRDARQHHRTHSGKCLKPLPGSACRAKRPRHGARGA